MTLLALYLTSRGTLPSTTTRWFLAAVVSAWGSLTVPNAQSGEREREEGERLFSLHVSTILSQKCLACHGEDEEKLKGAFDVRSREALLRGGENIDHVLVPGDASESFLLTSVRWEDPDFEMPPKENDRLSQEQIEKLERWIELGAPWPDESKQAAYREEERQMVKTEAGILVQTSGGLNEDWTYRRYQEEDLWAFHPVRRPDLPQAEASASGRQNPVDAFVGARIEAAGAAAAPQADPLTLVRRASYDLLGLPPTPEEIAVFMRAWEVDPDAAWSDLVDRLLESPHYGERWAQHWLDVARYADTAGFSNDYERSNAWRYRDYVVRAFNEDKPYDRFVLEQLAGDELMPGDAEGLVATGFLRMGPWGTAMVPQKEARQLFLDDLVNGVGQTFLATTMRCFKCHDHKFDPHPTRDYYRLYATFAATQPAEREAAFLEEENLADFEKGSKRVEALWQFAEDDRLRVVAKRESAARAWYEENELPYQPAEERRDPNIPDHLKPPRHVGLDHVDEGTLKVREQDTRIWNRRRERYLPLAQTVYNGPDGHQNSAKLREKEVGAGAMAPESFIHLGGAYQALGNKVTPGVLSALNLPVEGAPADDPYALPEGLHGRRSALAGWVADPGNALTTRSIVNRIWQGHFGRGLSADTNNFGVKGARPTHPLLLDWLASELVESGWSLKHLHRVIMTSETYRQAAHHPRRTELLDRDPDNALLAYFEPRRLTAEEVRDSLLATTGELNRQLGGLPAMPEINLEVALQPRMIQFSLAPAQLPDPMPDQRNRRSLYAYRVRGQADPFLEVFSQPNPNDACAGRESAAVTPQAFTLMNSDVVTDRSIALAQRLEREVPDDIGGQVKRAFSLVLGREAEDVEVARLTRYHHDMRRHHTKHEPEPKSYPTEITRSLVEEFSGKPFEYVEWLPAFEDYQADTKSWEVGVETRALADICLLLFNANEFIYVY